MTLADFVTDACSLLDPTSGAMQKIAAEFAAAMHDGLEGGASPLRMLPAYIARPTGGERGTAVAIDFGGTNVRIAKMRLADGRVQSNVPVAFSLKDPGGTYDYTREQIRAEDLFDFIAGHVVDVLEGDRSTLPLGHTFSFPCRQEGINRAVLIQWTKEIRTSGVEGRDVTRLLAEALDRQGARNVLPRAVINDTVGTLLAAAYEFREVDLGSICGTGHNTCYLEPCHPLTGKPMIVNIESGNFDGVPLTRFDREVNEASGHPGAQMLEKMVSGAYLGEVMLSVLRAMAAEGFLDGDTERWERGTLTSVHLTRILEDGPEGDSAKNITRSRLGLPELSGEQLLALRRLAKSVTQRSARLVGATYAGILRHLDPRNEREHIVAIDGSLYAHIPGYDAGIRAGLEAALGMGARGVTTRLVKDGSGIGAAIAALVADANA
jgi:hexokinase